MGDDNSHMEELQNTSEVKSLSKHCLRDLCDTNLDTAKKQAIKEGEYYVQVAEIKIFSESDGKKNIKQRYVAMRLPFVGYTYQMDTVQ